MDRDPRSQKEIAASAGVGESAMVNYKKGRIPRAEELFRLSKVLGVSMEWLLIGKEDQNNSGEGFGNSPRTSLHDGESEYVVIQKGRRIPVVGWAHAGEAQDYEELPADWQEWIPTDCRDAHAFAVRLEGESMAPRFEAGDVLVLMPEAEPYNGVLAVLRLATGGVIFRRVEMRGERLTLVPLNPQYRTEEFDRSEISWIYPVWGGWRQVWR